MKKKEEWKHLNKLWKKMQQHFKDFTRTEAPEELHQFRVQVKKIRSFLTLLESDKKNTRLLKHFKPVKKIFKSAGIIRDAYLHQKEAKAHSIKLPEFYETQARIQKEETKKLVSKRKKHIKNIKAVRRKLRKSLHPLPADEIKMLFNIQLNDTHRLLSRHNFSEQLHDGRKMLKHLMYNEHVVQGGIGKELNINFDYIDELQEVLGQWHDNKLALDFFSDNKLGSKDIASMKAKNSELEKAITEKSKGFNQKIHAKDHSPVEQ